MVNQRLAAADAVTPVAAVVSFMRTARIEVNPANGHHIRNLCSASNRLCNLPQDLGHIIPFLGCQLEARKEIREGWAFWAEAFDENGSRLQVQKIGSEVGDGGVTYETVAAELTKEYLETHKQGIRIRFDGQRAQQIILIPTNYIEGFFLKVDQTFANPQPR